MRVVEGPDMAATLGLFTGPMPDDQLMIDTTQCSPLHGLFARMNGSVIRAYVAVVCATYAPLVVAAALSPPPLTTAQDALRLPFLKDWNIAFMFLVSLPCLVVLTVTDHDVLASALRRVQVDGVLFVSPRAATQLTAKWSAWFRAVNKGAYAVGIVVGIALALLNYIAYRPATVGYWITSGGALTFGGYVFLYDVFVFYALIPLFVFRTVGISLLLRDLVAESELRMLPFHPDRCGGLRPVGRLGLRSQYALTVYGLNVVSLMVISFLYLRVPPDLYGLMIAAAVAYLVLGPIVFIGPLLPFRTGMLRTKIELMSEVAIRLRVELQRLRTQLLNGFISRDDEELIDRLRKIGTVIDELPVWPFDASTVRRFLTAYVIPLLGAVAYPLIQTVITKVF